MFHNERVPTKGKAYHKRCATCKTCEKNIGAKDILNGEWGAGDSPGAGSCSWSDT